MLVELINVCSTGKVQDNRSIYKKQVYFYTVAI